MNNNFSLVSALESKKIFILCALPQETNNCDKIIYTGLGKVNAAIKAVEIINEKRPRLLINYGTCGAVNTSLNGLIRIKKFIQHDIDCSPLGFEKGVTPYDQIQDISLSNDGYTCGSGDFFVSESMDLSCDVVDMEAYALAKACKLNNIEFLCYKYISDSADKSAGEEWKSNRSKGFALFLEEIRLKFTNELF